MNPTITSITLPVDTVQAVLAAHLNSEVLRLPIIVTGVELLDDTFILTLKPAPGLNTPAELPATVWTYPERSELIYTTSTAPHNGNGHDPQPLNLQPATAEEDTPEEDTTAAPPAVGRKSGQKRLPAVTPELRAAVLAAHAAGVPAARIASDLTIGYATARRIIVAAKAPPASIGEQAAETGPGAA